MTGHFVAQLTYLCKILPLSRARTHVGQFRTFNLVLARIEGAAADQGISFLVPEDLLPGDANTRRRWRQNYHKAGSQKFSELLRERAAMEEQQFKKEYAEEAEELRQLEEAESSRGDLSSSQKKRLDHLRGFQFRLGFEKFEHLEAWRIVEAPRLNLGLPALSLKDAVTRPWLLRAPTWRTFPREYDEGGQSKRGSPAT